MKPLAVALIAAAIVAAHHFSRSAAPASGPQLDVKHLQVMCTGDRVEQGYGCWSYVEAIGDVLSNPAMPSRLRICTPPGGVVQVIPAIEDQIIHPPARLVHEQTAAVLVGAVLISRYHCTDMKVGRT